MSSTEPATGADNMDASTDPPPAATAQAEASPDKPLSKNARKKLLKAQRWAETREAWKASKREKKKARKAADRAAKAASRPRPQKRPASPASTEGDPKRSKRPVLEPITLVMDCAFDDLMSDKEITSLSSQLTRAYHVNRTASRRVTLEITSLNKRLLTRYQTVLGNQHLRWKNVVTSPEPYDVNPDTVYLTADSPNTIIELEPGKKYVIGGIVDKNRHKNLCYRKATAEGLQHGKLPIGEYVSMASRFVLTTNQVVEIMVRWLECRDWKKAFLEVIPLRKMAVAKGAEEGGGGEVEEGRGGEEGEEEEGEEGEGEGGDVMSDEDGTNSPMPKTQRDEPKQGGSSLQKGEETTETTGTSAAGQDIVTSS